MTSHAWYHIDNYVIATTEIGSMFVISKWPYELFTIYMLYLSVLTELKHVW